MPDLTARAMDMHWPWCVGSAQHSSVPTLQLTWAVHGGDHTQTGEGPNCIDSRGSQAKDLDFLSLPQGCGSCGFGPPAPTWSYAGAWRAAAQVDDATRDAAAF
jgi:hypothetical protein